MDVYLFPCLFQFVCLCYHSFLCSFAMDDQLDEQFRSSGSLPLLNCIHFVLSYMVMANKNNGTVWNGIL